MSLLPRLHASLTTPSQLTLITSVLSASSTFLLTTLLTLTPATTPIHLLTHTHPLHKPTANLTVHTTHTSLTTALASTSPSNPPLLILHEPAYVLAAEGTPCFVLLDQIRGWHASALATVVFCAADDALMGSGARIEEEHRGFVVSLGHQAGVVVGCRGLDTGRARDVSGVLRVGGVGWEKEVGGDGGEGESEEWLYFVKDGGVEVFRRGEMRG